MKLVTPLATGLLAAFVQCSSVLALSLTNRDDHDHKVTIVEGSSSKDHMVKPDGVLDNVCAKGCIIRLNESEDDEYELEGTEVVSIEDGYLYYDTPDAAAQPGPGTDKPGDGKGAGQKK